MQVTQQRKQQKKQLALQRQANEDARQRAKEASDRADIEFNKANRRRADVSALQRKKNRQQWPDLPEHYLLVYKV